MGKLTTRTVFEGRDDINDISRSLGVAARTFCQAGGYLPSLRASSPFAGIILTKVWTTRPEFLHSRQLTGSRTASKLTPNLLHYHASLQVAVPVLTY